MSDVLAGTPLGDAIQAAQRAMQMGEVDAARNAYAQALVRLPAGVKGTELRRALCSEHVGGLLAHEHLRSAVAVAQDYIEQAQAAGDEPTQLVLLVLLAEAWAAQDAWPSCRQSLSRAQALLKTQPSGTAALGAQNLIFCACLGWWPPKTAITIRPDPICSMLDDALLHWGMLPENERLATTCGAWTW